MRILVILASLAIPSFSAASINLVFSYDPGTTTTTATYNGSWDMSSTNVFADNRKEITPTSFFSNNTTYSLVVAGIATPYPWTASLFATGQTGDSFAITSTFVGGPAAGFSDSTVISGSLIFAGTDLATLGLSDGQSGSLSGAAGSVDWSVTQIPEPSTTMAIAGLLVILMVLFSKPTRGSRISGME